MRLGTVVGFCRRQAFHERAPAAQDFHMFGVGQHSVREGSGRKMAPVFAERRLLGLCDTPVKQEVMHSFLRNAIMHWLEVNA